MAKVKQEWDKSKWPHRDIGRYGPLPNKNIPKAKKLNKSFKEGYG